MARRECVAGSISASRRSLKPLPIDQGSGGGPACSRISVKCFCCVRRERGLDIAPSSLGDGLESGTHLEHERADVRFAPGEHRVHLLMLSRGEIELPLQPGEYPPARFGWRSLGNSSANDNGQHSAMLDRAVGSSADRDAGESNQENDDAGEQPRAAE